MASSSKYLLFKFPVLEHLVYGNPKPSYLVQYLAAKKEKSPNKVFNKLNMHFYANRGHVEVVDISMVQCLVGQLMDKKLWAMIDRSGNLA